jgi:hypothetical protein
MASASVERQAFARQAAKRRRAAVARIELALRELRRGRIPNLAGITFDVEIEGADGGSVELGRDALRVLLEAERDDLRDEIDLWNRKAETFTPTSTQLGCKCPGEVRHRTAPRPRERRERAARRSSSSPTSGDHLSADSDSDPPGVDRAHRRSHSAVLARREKRLHVHSKRAPAAARPGRWRPHES